jgi:hypothetical protein
MANYANGQSYRSQKEQYPMVTKDEATAKCNAMAIQYKAANPDTTKGKWADCDLLEVNYGQK